jgi:hypothetical protein
MITTAAPGSPARRTTIARTLLAAARDAGAGHVVLISIVGPSTFGWATTGTRWRSSGSLRVGSAARPHRLTANEAYTRAVYAAL